MIHRKRRRTFAWAVGLIWFVAAATAVAEAPEQPSSLDAALEQQNSRRINNNQIGMGILMGWAGLNMAVGSIGYFTSSGRSKYFHQMNAGWNIVNAGLATAGLISAAGESAGSYGAVETIRQAEFLEKLLLFNAGLDVGYMAFGMYLKERGRRTNQTRLRGFGDSLLVQGGFLFLFDLGLFWVHHSNASSFYETIRPMIGPGMGASVGFSF